MTPEFLSLARAAVNCNACFTDGALVRDGIGCPQPFTVGSRYWDAPRRVVLVGINPGAGKNATYKQARKVTVARFMAGDDSAFADFALDAEADVPLWGNGKYMARIKALGLRLFDIALGNIALCATRDNKYPGSFLRRCFSTHTLVAMKALDPHAVILYGAAAERFMDEIAGALPGVEVISMMHPAHREGGAAEERECAEVRAMIEEVAA